VDTDLLFASKCPYIFPRGSNPTAENIAKELGQKAIELLKPYKAQYLPQATDVRETVSFSYTSGGASLLDFLDAQNQYRTTQLSYLNLIGSYLSAANQLNFAVGREVIQ